MIFQLFFLFSLKYSRYNRKVEFVYSARDYLLSSQNENSLRIFIAEFKDILNTYSLIIKDNMLDHFIFCILFITNLHYLAQYFPTHFCHTDPPPLFHPLSIYLCIYISDIPEHVIFTHLNFNLNIHNCSEIIY